MSFSACNPVAYAAHGFDQLEFGFAVHFLSEALHVDVDQVGFRIEVIVPDLFANLGASQNPARTAHQVLQQCKFTRRQFDPATRTGDLPREQIAGEIGNRKDALGAPRARRTTARIRPIDS